MRKRPELRLSESVILQIEYEKYGLSIPFLLYKIEIRCLIFKHHSKLSVQKTTPNKVPRVHFTCQNVPKCT